jgi:hypothetical protein
MQCVEAVDVERMLLLLRQLLGCGGTTWCPVLSGCDPAGVAAATIMQLL